MNAVVLEYEGGMQDVVENIYALEIPHAANLTLELTYPDASADLDLILMSLDSESRMSVVAASNARVPGSSEKITTSVLAGRYYVGVSAVEGSSVYALTLSAPELFEESNVQIAEMVLNASGYTDRSWVSAGERTTLKGTVAVTDPSNDATKERANRRTVYETNSDEEAFAKYEPAATTPARRRAVPSPGRCPADQYAVSPLSQAITSSASTGTIDVTAKAGCIWTASSNVSWLTITAGRSGVGNGTVSYSFLANSSTSTRTASLSVAGKTVSITQNGACSYTVSPTSQDIAAAGGTGTITVTTRSDCAWTATVSTSATWITITAGQSGTGNGTVEYSVAANASTSKRSGTMTVAGRTVTISQSLDTSMCSYTLEYTSKSITWCGGERTIQVTTQGDCPWTATSDASWLTIVLPSRTGTRTLSYSVAPNSTASSRQATLTIADKAVIITQSARSGGGTYEGNWTGTTNSGRSVALCVASNAIQSASITVVLDFPTFTCRTPLIRQAELPITGNTFSGTFTTYPEVSNVFTTVRGTFTSSTAMNGRWDPYSQSYFIFCGSTIGFGTGGEILSSGTFTATKQP